MLNTICDPSLMISDQTLRPTMIILKHERDFLHEAYFQGLGDQPLPSAIHHSAEVNILNSNMKFADSLD